MRFCSVSVVLFCLYGGETKREMKERESKKKAKLSLRNEQSRKKWKLRRIHHSQKDGMNPTDRKSEDSHFNRQKRRRIHTLDLVLGPWFAVPQVEVVVSCLALAARWWRWLARPPPFWPTNRHTAQTYFYRSSLALQAL